MTWAVRIRAGDRVGTGAVISPTLVLTCEHVVRGVETVGVTREGGASTFRILASDASLDVALLAPEKPNETLRASSILIPRSLWRGARPTKDGLFVELCTDEPDTPRSLQIDVRPAPANSRRVQFVVLSSREGVRRGFSGGPVVEITNRLRTPRLLGIVRARDETSVDALDNAGAGWFVPIDCVAESFEQIGALIEEPFLRQPSWHQHWEPRSRGVATSKDPGFFFSGRMAAYERVVRQLDGGSGLLIVTGSRGRGKSAVLARAVVLSSRRYVFGLGEDARDAVDGYEVPQRPVDAVVLARHMTRTGVASEIGKQLGRDSTSPSELVAAVEHEGDEPSIVIDAVDEADDASALLQELIIPLARAGARIAIGALRRVVSLDVPSDATWVDLDVPPYRDNDAITNFVTRRLVGGGKYDTTTATMVAGAVADRARGIFLVAELIARTLGQRDPIDVTEARWKTQIPRDGTEAFGEYLARFGASRTRVLALLHPLALARGDGLTIEPGDVWLAAANRLKPPELTPFTQADLRDAYGDAHDYLISERDSKAIRLYHEGLADAVNSLAVRLTLDQAERPTTADAIEQEIQHRAQAFVETLVELLPNEPAPVATYLKCDPYLLENLPFHLSDHGWASQLLDRPGLLLTAEQTGLRAALVRGARGIPFARDGARVAIVHALSWPHANMHDRAAAICAGLERQGDVTLCDRIRQALADGEPPGGWSEH